MKKVLFALIVCIGLLNSTKSLAVAIADGTNTT